MYEHTSIIMQTFEKTRLDLDYFQYMIGTNIMEKYKQT